jgi:hypothetical protein
MVSPLVTRGYGTNSALITRGFGPLTIIITPTPPTVGGFTGGGSSLAGTVVPEAIAIAEIRIKIKHVQPFVRHFSIKTRHVNFIEKLPVKIRHVVLKLTAKALGMTVTSLIQGLSLKITNTGMNIDEGQS